MVKSSTYIRDVLAPIGVLVAATRTDLRDHMARRERDLKHVRCDPEQPRHQRELREWLAVVVLTPALRELLHHA